MGLGLVALSFAVGSAPAQAGVTDTAINTTSAVKKAVDRAHGSGHKVAKPAVRKVTSKIAAQGKITKRSATTSVRRVAHVVAPKRRSAPQHHSSPRPDSSVRDATRGTSRRAQKSTRAMITVVAETGHRTVIKETGRPRLDAVTKLVKAPRVVREVVKTVKTLTKPVLQIVSPTHSVVAPVENVIGSALPTAELPAMVSPAVLPAPTATATPRSVHAASALVVLDRPLIPQTPAASQPAAAIDVSTPSVEIARHVSVDVVTPTAQDWASGRGQADSRDHSLPGASSAGSAGATGGPGSGSAALPAGLSPNPALGRALVHGEDHASWSISYDPGFAPD